MVLFTVPWMVIRSSRGMLPNPVKVLSPSAGLAVLMFSLPSVPRDLRIFSKFTIGSRRNKSKRERPRFFYEGHEDA